MGRKQVVLIPAVRNARESPFMSPHAAHTSLLTGRILLFLPSAHPTHSYRGSGSPQLALVSHRAVGGNSSKDFDTWQLWVQILPLPSVLWISFSHVQNGIIKSKLQGSDGRVEHRAGPWTSASPAALEVKHHSDNDLAIWSRPFTPGEEVQHRKQPLRTFSLRWCCLVPTEESDCEKSKFLCTLTAQVKEVGPSISQGWMCREKAQRSGTLWAHNRLQHETLRGHMGRAGRWCCCSQVCTDLVREKWEREELSLENQHHTRETECKM